MDLLQPWTVCYKHKGILQSPKLSKSQSVVIQKTSDGSH